MEEELMKIMAPWLDELPSFFSQLRAVQQEFHQTLIQCLILEPYSNVIPDTMEVAMVGKAKYNSERNYQEEHVEEEEQETEFSDNQEEEENSVLGEWKEKSSSSIGTGSGSIKKMSSSKSVVSKWYDRSRKIGLLSMFSY